MSSSSSPPSHKIYEIRKRNLDPKTAVLPVIDMQNAFYSIARDPDSPQRCGNCHMTGYNKRTFAANNPQPNTTATGANESRKGYDDLGTELEEVLKKMGVEEVIVSGVMTNLCCETTARDAFIRGFVVFFSTDATATSSEGLHEATLKNMAFGFAYLLDCRRIQDSLL